MRYLSYLILYKFFSQIYNIYFKRKTQYHNKNHKELKIFYLNVPILFYKKTV